MDRNAKKELSYIFSPIQIGPTTIKNRIFVPAHNVGMADNGLPTDDDIEYRRKLAAGGAGLQITGATSVHSTGLSVSHALMGHTDRIIPGYRKLARTVHNENGKILVQLAHFGALGNSVLSEKPLWSPSPIESEIVREIPHEMSKAEIKEIIQAFGEAVRRVKEGGMDGVEINCAHGLLIHEFLSPYSNFREDEYGGSLENRMRFLLEILRKVSEQAGSSLIVGIRISADEMVENGIDLAEAKKISKLVEETCNIHYINVISGTNLDRFQRWSHWPATPSKKGLFVNLAKGIKEVVQLPVFTVGRVTDLLHAEKIIKEKAADMVGMVRAHIADPNIVRKALNGNINNIRPCVGANICINRNQRGLPIRCIHNPVAGRALKLKEIKRSLDQKRVIVIGGGPAGLEVARVAALRGHSVKIFERQEALGGQLLLWSKAPHMSELSKIIDWQQKQLENLGVEINLNTKIEIDTLHKMKTNVLIVATGSSPRPLEFKLLKDPHFRVLDSNIKILTPHELLRHEKNLPHKVILWDRNEGEAGTQSVFCAAELLAEKGSEIYIVSPNFAVGEDLHPNLRTPLFQRLLTKNVTLIPNSEIKGIDKNNVSIRNLFSRQNTIMNNIDGLVAWIGSDVNDSIYQSSINQFSDVQAIGDCVSPRTVEVAMAEGARIGRLL